MTPEDFVTLTTPLMEAFESYRIAMMHAATGEGRAKVRVLADQTERYLREMAYVAGIVPRPHGEPPIEFRGER